MENACLRCERIIRPKPGRLLFMAHFYTLRLALGGIVGHRNNKRLRSDIHDFMKFVVYLWNSEKFISMEFDHIQDSFLNLWDIAAIHGRRRVETVIRELSLGLYCVTYVIGSIHMSYTVSLLLERWVLYT